MMPFGPSDVSTAVAGVTRSATGLTLTAAGLALGFSGTPPVTTASVVGAAVAALA